MKRIDELETPAGVFRVSDGEKNIPFDIRPNRYLDRPWKVRDDDGIAVGTIDTDAKFSIYVPLADLEPDRDYTISFSAGEWQCLGEMDTGYCYHAVIGNWVIGIGAEDPDRGRSIFYSVSPLEENNGYRFRINDSVRANAHFDVAWVETGTYQLKDYTDAVYSWLYPRVWIEDMRKHREEPFRELEGELWRAVQTGDAEAFTELVYEDAVIIRGGYRYNCAAFAETLRESDSRTFAIERFEVVCETEEIIQTYYVVVFEVEGQSGLSKKHFVTTTWKKSHGAWKAIFHMVQ